MNEYSVNERERPDAGEEWTAKAIMMGAEFCLDQSMVGWLWAVKLPGNRTTEYFGVTKARACRKLVRSIVGDTDAPIRPYSAHSGDAPT